jgi:uncharacterized Zn finger protein
MWGYGYTYTTVAQKQAKARRQLEKLKKKNPGISPVVINGRKIAKTWWGAAWIDNLTRYADYANRIGRGRSYVQNGLVLDLQIGEGRISALVSGSGSKPYDVEITIGKLSKSSWKAITDTCGHKIESIERLAEGKFPAELSGVFTAKGKGMFPSPDEIKFSCSCPDWAYMCKHVAAALFAAGARLDEDPMLFFRLRGIDFEALLKKSVEAKMESMLKNSGKKTSRVMDDASIKDVFNINFDSQP